MTNTPKVSVCMIAYNEEDYIVESIESVLNQTFEDFELIILDDGSTDRTFERAAGIKDPRIRIYRQKNSGRPKSRNTVLRYCRGEYIASLDADDTFLPEKLEQQVHFLEHNKHVDLVSGDRYRVDKSGNIIKLIRLPTSYRALPLLAHLK